MVYNDDMKTIISVKLAFRQISFGLFPGPLSKIVVEVDGNKLSAATA